MNPREVIVNTNFEKGIVCRVKPANSREHVVAESLSDNVE
jgi:hypothetical protein